MKKFNSQICTTREQSERLLSLGLRKETADMAIEPDLESTYEVYYISAYPPSKRGVPAWSLHRLIEMMPIAINDMLWFNATHDTVLYDSLDYIKTFDVNDYLYGNIIDCIEWLIKEGYFNKEYLEE